VPPALHALSVLPALPRLSALLPHLLLPCLLLPVLLLPLAAPAGAMSLYEGWTVTGVEIVGIDETLAGSLRNGLALNVHTGFLRLRKARFRERFLEQDRERARYFLARHGFPQAVVESRLEPAADKQQLLVILEVSPGPEVRIGSVEVEVARAGTGHSAEVDALADLNHLIRTELPVGSRFADDRLQALVSETEDRLRAAGYAQAAVSLRLVRSDAARADVTLIVDPGSIYTFESVTATGVPDDLAPLARRAMGVTPGTRYAPQVIDDARDNLRALRLFRQIRLAAAPTGPLSLELQADLKPSPPRTARISVGSWSDDSWRVSALWRHRNLLRRGRGAEVAGTVSEHRQMLGGSLWWPALFTSRSRTELQIQYHIEDEVNYYLTNTELELATVLRPARRTSLRLGVGVSEVDVDARSGDQQNGDPLTVQDRTGRLTVLSASLHRDRADNLLYPTRGSRLNLSARWSPPGILSQSPFWSLAGQEIVYLPIGERWVVASRVALGVAHHLGEASQLLPNFRYFAGGVTTMRGFKRRELGPVDASDNPIGGEARLLGSLEVRFPIWKFIGGTLFTDSGQVWQRLEHIAPGELEVATGACLVFFTPIGPVCLGGSRLLGDPPAGRPATVLHVAIGYAF